MMRPKLLSAVFLGLLILFPGSGAEAQRREIQERYVQQFRHKAMFLKIPIRGTRQIVYVGQAGTALDRSNINLPVAFKVGDQVRITDVNFRGDHVRFRVASPDMSRESELVFQFSNRISDDFSEEPWFRGALETSFTEGLTYTEIESAREQFIHGQFDQLIQQFATTTGTTPEYVIETISEQNPKYSAARRELAEVREKVQRLEQELARETKARREGEGNLNTLRSEISVSRNALQTLREERDQLSARLNSLEKQQSASQNRIQDAEKQVLELARVLNVQTPSGVELNRRLQAVTSGAAALRRERDELTSQVTEFRNQVESLQGERQKLTAELREVRAHRDRFDADLKALTRDKDSLQAEFLEMRRRKESLETAERLTAALRLENHEESSEEGRFQVSDVLLGKRKIGTLSVKIPETPGQVYPVRFRVESPDTVSFDDEERQLFRALGEKIQIATTWRAPSDVIEATLVGSDIRQTVAPRENAEWHWAFEGDLNRPERVALVVDLTDVDGNRIPLADLEFVMTPGGLMHWVRGALSPISMLVGLVLGFGVFGFLFGLRGNRRSAGSQSKSAWPPPPVRTAVGEPKGTSSQSQKPDSGYVTQKKF